MLSCFDHSLRRRLIARLVWILAILAVSDLEAQRYGFKHYLRESGLTNLVVMSLLQDRTGFIWAGTQNGLFRYDGTRFKRYGTADGLPSTRVYVMHQSDDGTLWVGTQNGLVQIKGESIAEAPSVGNHAVFGLDSAKDGTLYVGTSRGLLISRSAAGSKVPAFRRAGGPAAVVSEAVHGVHVGPTGTVWAGCGQDLCRLSSGRLEVVGPEEGVPRARWDDMVTDPDGVLWIRSSRHLYVKRRNAATFESIDGQEVPDSSLFGRICLRRNGEILLSTDQGVAARVGEGWELIGEPQGLNTSLTSCLTEDHEGSLWIGTRGGGVARWLGRNRWQNWTEAEGLSDNGIRAIVRDTSGTVWVGTDGGLNALAPGETRWRNWGEEHGLGGNAIRMVLAGPNGNIWTASFPGGVSRLDPRTGALQSYQAESGLGSDRVMGIYIDEESRLWAATARGLFRSANLEHPLRFELVSIPSVRDHGRFSRFLRTQDGSLWVASHQGLLRRKNGRWTRFTRSNGLKSDQVLYLAEDRSGDLWIAYLEALGATKLSFPDGSLQLRHVTSQDGPQSDKVIFLGFDLLDRLWYGTDAGVDVLGESGWEHYSRSDGLVWDSGNGDAFYADRDESVWIGTSGGLSHFRPPRDLQSAVSSPALFTSVVLGKTASTRPQPRGSPIYKTR